MPKKQFSRLNPDGLVFPPDYTEKREKCKECQNVFTITVKEQNKIFYINWSLPKRCKDCRLQRYIDKKYGGDQTLYELEEGDGCLVVSGDENLVGFIEKGCVKFTDSNNLPWGLTPEQL